MLCGEFSVRKDWDKVKNYYKIQKNIRKFRWIMKSKLNTMLQSPDRFKLLPDGWIQDNFLGVDIGPSSEKKMEFKDAVKYCEDLGSRLPTIHELHSLVDFSKEHPASYPILNMKHDDWYWSSEQTAWTKKKSTYKSFWVVSFSYGYVGSSFEYGSSYVRPVRASQ